ncbi:MAG: hypothetical protein K8H85_00020 [Cyclobacteriaceae bacterium]|nr:hypothetical protein [Cyclobacteriaceae bacterium]
MKFELEFFDEFIKTHCGTRKKSVIPDFAKKLSLIDEEIERVKKAFTNQLFLVENERRIELFIKHHQTHIIRLADKVVSFIDKEETLNLNARAKGPSKFNLCEALLQAFESLLNYIEIHFTKYFDQDQKIPDSYAFISVREFQEKLEVIKEILVIEKVDSRLREIVLYPIEQFVNTPDKENITFRRLIYLKYLTKGIINLQRQEIKTDFTQAVYEHLFYLNYNSYHLLQYATKIIREQLEPLPSITSQLEHLSLILKTINQAHVKPSFALKPGRESLKGLLSNWIEEEIHFMEKKCQLTLLIPPGGHQDRQEEFKVKTTLSVPQLAYSIRLLKETGIITNENKAALIRFFSRNFSSAHNENISTESFRSKYFGFERSAVSHVQDVLNKLMIRSKQDE